MNQVTASSRQVFAFARDRGLPFHQYLSKVTPDRGVPANSVYVTLAVTCLLALIQIGSTAAFNIILSVSATSLFTSYIICIGSVLWKRLRGEGLPDSKFHLGKFGVPVNIFALCFLLPTFFLLFFPAEPHPDAADMNWGSLIYGVAALSAALYYYLKARHEYEGPVCQIKRQAE